MYKRLTITLLEAEKNALRILAEREYRDTHAQAALIIRAELERLGLITLRAPSSQETQLVPTGQGEHLDHAK